MEFPLQLTFKTVAVAPQISVEDATGQLVFYVKQKVFKLKEAVTVFADREQSRPLYKIAADRVIDISAQYNFENSGGTRLGAVRRKGMRSLWRASYEILNGDGAGPVMSIREENPWVKVMDGVAGQVPILGMFTGYLFHPAFRVTRTDGTAVMRAEKQPAFLEGRYRISKLEDLDRADEGLAVLSLLMMLLLERRRG